MSKLSNELTMIKLLENRKYSVLELSKILEVSQRMVRIYKSDIEMSGIIVETIMGKNGGYKILNNKDNFIIVKKEYQKMFNDINYAIKNNEKIYIKYKTKNTITERTIEPSKIFLYKDNYIVSAYCELRKDIRNFEFK